MGVVSTTYPVGEIARSLATLLVERGDVTRITVTQQELDYLVSLFRVKGIKPDGSHETRGRKRKE